MRKYKREKIEKIETVSICIAYSCRTMNKAWDGIWICKAVNLSDKWERNLYKGNIDIGNIHWIRI